MIGTEESSNPQNEVKSVFFYEGQRCPVCNTLFSEEDDIVSCPDCGAPHHRACWLSEGHCHFAADHGTENQWKRVPVGEVEEDEDEDGEEAPAVNRCPNCGAENPEHAEFCGYCGRPISRNEWSSAQQPRYGQYQPPMNEYAPFRASFDPLGGVPRDEKFENGTTAEELAAYVAGNTVYYIPRFSRLKEGRLFQWNWAAFFFAPYWLLFRKQYLPGALVSLMYLAMDTMMNLIVYWSGAPALGTVNQAVDAVMNAGYTLPFFLLLIGMITLHLLLGFFGNRIYMEGAVKRIGRVREEEPENLHLSLRQAGGVSFVWCAVAYALINLVSAMFTTLK